MKEKAECIIYGSDKFYLDEERKLLQCTQCGEYYYTEDGMEFEAVEVKMN